MIQEINKTIGEMVAEDYRTASIFKKHKIDFCCDGNRRLQEACEAKNLDSKKIAIELTKVSTGKAGELTANFRAWPLDLLTDYVEKTHHRYVTEKTKDIQSYLNKICQAHGERHPELFEIKEVFDISTGELAVHMKKEELMLFPLIRNLDTAINAGKAPKRSVEARVNQMMAEHDQEGERFRKIAELSNNYTPPADACNTYKVTFGLLQEFEEDLHLHIHLENNILFPNAIKLEKELSN